MSSIRWEMRAPLPYCHSCAFVCELLAVVVRAPPHTIRIRPVAPIQCMCLDHLVVGLRAALYGSDFQEGCIRPPKTSLYGVYPVDV